MSMFDDATIEKDDADQQPVDDQLNVWDDSTEEPVAEEAEAVVAQIVVVHDGTEGEQHQRHEGVALHA